MRLSYAASSLQRGLRATATPASGIRSLSIAASPLSARAPSTAGSSPLSRRQNRSPAVQTTASASASASASSQWTALSSSGARAYSASSLEEPLGKTALYDLHLAHGGKMVPFGGFHMPVQYPALSVSASHAFTRTHASLFDVSHMVQRTFRGPGAVAFLQRVTPADLDALADNTSTLSTLLHPTTGGIVDDTVITKLAPDEFYVVTNAACRAKDDAYLSEQLAAFDGPAVEHTKADDAGLIALQGPLSAEILTAVLGVDVSKLYFGTCTRASVRLPQSGSTSVLISRGGYTGEDGFEISIPTAEDTVAVTEALLATAGPEKLQLAGLGARDSLRLEAGMCLYGHDLDDTTTPVEAGLSWIIPKERRKADAGFHGAEVIAKQLVPKTKGGSGVERRRVGFIVEGAPAREGAEIVSKDGEKIGTVTSGCPSPTLGKNIAMGYVKDGFHKSGTELDIVVRGRNRKATVTKMPFVPTKYWKGTAPA